MDIFQKSITPDKPRVLAEEQIYVYVPMATSTNAGIASYNRDQFDIIGSEVSLKWPAESFVQGPIETPSIVKVLDNEFEYTGNLVDLISGNSKISSDKLEVQLKRILRDAYERPELVMLDPNYFVRTIVEKDGKQYYKYNTTAVHYNMSQTLSEDEQTQARQNISASSVLDNEATNKRIDALLQTGVYTVNGKTGNVILKNSDIENDTNYATEQYVQENGGKIDKIVLNNNEQEIINKIVTLTIDKTTVGLSNVDNTSDLDKPISNATQQALDTKMDKSGGIFTGNVGVQGNLSVSGTIITKDTETLKVQDNVIVTNANKIELLDLSGLAINKNDTQTYGIMYDVVDDSVKLGLGSIDSYDKFTFNEGEGSPVATRSDSSSLTDNHLLKWDATNNKLVDSGYSAEDKLDKISKSSTHQRAYIVGTDGSQNSIAVSITSTAPEESLIKRDKWGCAEVDTPAYSENGKRIVNQEYVKTHFYTKTDDIKHHNIYTGTIYNWLHYQTDKTEDAHSKIDFTPYSTEILTTTKDDESARIKLGADPRTTSTVSESQAHVDISIGKPNDYSTGITLSNNYQEVYGDGISMYTLQNNLTEARILTLSANGLFISEGLELNEETQNIQLKNKKEISPNVIRYDIEQTLTDEQKAQARQNISASSISDNDATNKRIDAYKLEVDANTAARHVHDNKEILDGTTASYTTEEKAKLNGIADGAEVNVQADWKQTDSSSKDYIKNKPVIPDGIKLYSSTGENTDGAMTQKAVTDEFKNNISILFAESERQKSKNLFNINNGIYKGALTTSGGLATAANVSFSINNETITLTTDTYGWRGIHSEYFKLKGNTVYTLSYRRSDVVAFLVCFYDSSYTFISSVYEQGNTQKTFTVPTNTAYVRFGIQNISVGTVTISDIQIEEGSVATEYQPYNGQITHNGDAPVVFAESERQKSKNLLEVNNGLDKTNLGLHVQINNNIITVDGTPTHTTAISVTAFNPKIYAGKTYTLSFKDYSNVNGFDITVTGTRNDGTQRFNMLNLTPVITSTTITADVDYELKIEIYAAANDTASGTFKLQLEENSVATDYQPYNGAIVHDKQLTEQLSNYLPLSGGTLTGRLKLGNGAAISDANDITILTHYTDNKNYFGHENYESVIRGSKTTINNPLTISNKSFNYSAIEQGSANADRNVWFSDNTAVGKPVYNNNFKYNPSTNILKVGSLSLTSVPTVNDVNVALTSDISIQNFTTYTVIDATALDENTWYPVTFDASRKNLKIMLFNQWNGGNPSWATHSTKNYGCVKIWETTGNGWGELGAHRRVHLSVFTYTSTDPVRGVGQLGNSSTEYVYVRGGGKYNFYTSHNVVPALRTSTYTVSGESVSPVTTAPAEIVQTIMSTDTNQTISGSKTFTSDVKLTKGAIIKGRVHGSGDDEGLIIEKADNGYACMCLGSPSGERAVLYLTSDGNSIWRLSTGSSKYDISHPKKAGTIALTSDIPNLLDKVYPVGSIYMSTKNNSPASFLGGTWLQLKDTFLLAHGDTYTSTKSATDSQVTSEGGEATHTLTIAEMPSHNHKTTLYYSGSSGSAGVYGSRNKDARTYTSTSTGGSSAHNNMPPYLVVYMWKRTA